MTSIGATDTRTAQGDTLGQELERVGWALFLIMIGGLALLPSGWVPKGTWLIGTGLIMIGLNIVRHIKGIQANGFTNVLGLVALALGISAVAAVDLPVFPILLAAIGLQMIYNVMLARRVAS